jgi:hypothetical protein
VRQLDWQGPHQFDHTFFLRLFELDMGPYSEKDTLYFLEDAFQERSPEMVFLQKKPDFDFLHSDLQFQTLAKKVGLPPAP